MSDWNAELYLRFKQQRTQPAKDLASRLRGRQAARAVDLGCGPGNSTAVLHAAFPQTEILGIDNSPDMIAKARAAQPELAFELRDVHALEGGWDIIFSNACLQWLPDHAALLPELMGKLNAGGTLAVQMPRNQDEPLFRIIREAAADPKWGFPAAIDEANHTLDPAVYYGVLLRCAGAFDLWETVYCHPMPSHQALIDWVRATRLRPYLDHLGEERGAAFERELLERVRAVYPVQEDGAVLLSFRRLFFVAEKKL